MGLLYCLFYSFCFAIHVLFVLQVDNELIDRCDDAKFDLGVACEPLKTEKAKKA